MQVRKPRFVGVQSSVGWRYTCRASLQLRGSELPVLLQLQMQKKYLLRWVTNDFGGTIHTCIVSRLLCSKEKAVQEEGSAVEKACSLEPSQAAPWSLTRAQLQVTLSLAANIETPIPKKPVIASSQAVLKLQLQLYKLHVYHLTSYPLPRSTSTNPSTT